MGHSLQLVESEGMSPHERLLNGLNLTVFLGKQTSKAFSSSMSNAERHLSAISLKDEMVVMEFLLN